MTATERIGAGKAGLARLHELAPGAIGRSVVGRFGSVPPEAIALAEAVALLGRQGELRHAAALAELSVSAGAEAADRLVSAGLFEPGRPLRFAHPIVRSAVYADIPAGRRAAAHGRAARLLAAEDQAPDHVAPHLMACERAGDGWVVEQLRHAARSAVKVGAPAAAIGDRAPSRPSFRPL